MLILGNTFEDFLTNLQNYFLSTFGLLGTSAGTIIHTGADLTSDAARTSIDIVEDSLHNAGNLMAGNGGYDSTNISGEYDSTNISGNLMGENAEYDEGDLSDVVGKNIDTEFDSGNVIAEEQDITMGEEEEEENVEVESFIENYTSSNNPTLNRRGARRRLNSTIYGNSALNRGSNITNGVFNNRNFQNLNRKTHGNIFQRNTLQRNFNNMSQNNVRYNGNVFTGSRSRSRYSGNNISKFGNIVPAWTKTNSYYNPNSTPENIKFNAWNHNHQPSSINKALNKQSMKSANIQSDTSDGSMQKQISSNKNAWCLIGEYQNKRGCVSVTEDDICMSGQLFPSKEKCLDPGMLR
jgi:hypothetical protein